MLYRHILLWAPLSTSGCRSTVVLNIDWWQCTHSLCKLIPRQAGTQLCTAYLPFPRWQPRVERGNSTSHVHLPIDKFTLHQKHLLVFRAAYSCTSKVPVAGCWQWSLSLSLSLKNSSQPDCHSSPTYYLCEEIQLFPVYFIVLCLVLV